MREILFKGKRLDNGEWVQGYLFCIWGRAYICWGTINDVPDMKEVDPETVCRHTGKIYMDKEEAYEGDIFESQSCGLIMILRYGTFQAYCPVDNEYMDSVGFYAEAAGYPQMPIGDISDYAIRIGNIFDNPELLAGSGITENSTS